MKYITPFILLFLMSCNKTSSSMDQVKYHDDGVAKPKVAVIKVMDTSSHNLDWDLASEFTEFLLEQLFSRSKFYLTNDFHMIGSEQLSQLKLSPYSDDMSWLLEMNNSSEFVLFTEILKHNLQEPKNTNYNPLSHIKTLDLSLRICVLDIRKSSPRVVLQEIITKQYSIPFNFGSYNDSGSSLKKTTFSLSPLAFAHKNIVSEISKEIEDYILIAQSNIYD